MLTDVTDSALERQWLESLHLSMEPIVHLTSAATTRLASSPGTCALALAVPTLREAGTIGAVLDRVRKTLDPLGISYQVIVVDDDSNDGTEAIVRAISDKDPRVQLRIRTGQRGLGGAVHDAWKQSDAEVLGVIDADLQHPPELLVQLWRKIQEGQDVVIASRYAASGDTSEWHPVRRWLSRVTTFLTWFVQKPSIRVRDPLSGFFLVRRSCVADLSVKKQGFKILLEILVRGRISSVAEVPFFFGTRHSGASKADLRTGFEFLHLLGRLWKTKVTR